MIVLKVAKCDLLTQDETDLRSNLDESACVYANTALLSGLAQFYIVSKDWGEKTGGFLFVNKPSHSDYLPDLGKKCKGAPHIYCTN